MMKEMIGEEQPHDDIQNDSDVENDLENSVFINGSNGLPSDNCK